MVKIKSKRKLKWCLINYSEGKIKQKWAAKYLGITTRRFRQILKKCQETGTILTIGLNMGRPRKQAPGE